LTSHRFSCHGLRPFFDLAATVESHREELDWSQVQARAVEWRAGLGVYVALRLARDLAQAAVPTAVLAALRPSDFDEPGYDLAREVALLTDEPPAVANELALPRAVRLAHAATEPSFTGKLSGLLRAVFPSQRHMAIYMEQFHALPLTGLRRYTCYFTRALDLCGGGLRFLRYGLTHRREAMARARQLKHQAQLARWLAGKDQGTRDQGTKGPGDQGPRDQGPRDQGLKDHGTTRE
jgi:hypothetical protein